MTQQPDSTKTRGSDHERRHSHSSPCLLGEDDMTLAGGSFATSAAPRADIQQDSKVLGSTAALHPQPQYVGAPAAPLLPPYLRQSRHTNAVPTYKDRSLLARSRFLLGEEQATSLSPKDEFRRSVDPSRLDDRVLRGGPPPREDFLVDSPSEPSPQDTGARMLTGPVSCGPSEPARTGDRDPLSTLDKAPIRGRGAAAQWAEGGRGSVGGGGPAAGGPPAPRDYLHREPRESDHDRGRSAGEGRGRGRHRREKVLPREKVLSRVYDTREKNEKWKMSDEECTFAPKICAKSRQMVRRRREGGNKWGSSGRAMGGSAGTSGMTHSAAGAASHARKRKRFVGRPVLTSSGTEEGK